MAAHSLIQGDSFAYDFSSKAVDSFEVDWAGDWAIVDSLGGTTIASGTLGKSADYTKMELRILPAETAAITPGKYILVVQINNDTIGFKQEVMQDRLTITEQGIAS